MRHGPGARESLIDVSAGLSWFFRDNLSLGVRFGYGNTSLDLNHAELLNILKLENKHIRRETYAGALALRGYMPLFDSKIFALFCEGRLTGSFGYGKNYAETDRGNPYVFGWDWQP